MPVQTIVQEGFLRPDQEKTYHYVHFEVPSDTVRIVVEYNYDQRISADPTITGGNTIDLGVFDSHGLDFLGAGFRGWSGSERAAFTITETEAAPGYLAGPLTPGTWHVVLGLYKIAPNGCHFQVTAHITTQPGHHPADFSPHMEGNLPTSPPTAQYSPWLRGQLHCHTHHSDGKLSVSQLIAIGRQSGFDFLAITDHNTTASQVEQAGLGDPGLILIRGMEVTTFMGHFNIWGVPDWVDFRALGEDDIRAALSRAVERAALTSCNHPKHGGAPWDFLEVNHFHCVEVWNGPWEVQNQDSLDYWLKLLAAGRRIPAVAGSDFHHDEFKGFVIERALGAPCTWVYAPGAASAAEILKAVRAGHVCLTQQPEGPLVDLRAGEGFTALGGDALARPGADLALRVNCLNGAGGELRLLDQNEMRFSQMIDQSDCTISCIVPVENSLYLRAELRNGDGRMLAMTNPVYFD